MRLITVRESKAGREIAENILAERLMRDFPDLLADSRALGNLAVIPFYSISLECLREGKIDEARRSGWRYLWSFQNSNVGAIVDISRQMKKVPIFSTYQKNNSLPVNLEKLESILRTKARRNTRAYYPRILHLPWAFVEVLWLCPRSKKGKNLFVSLTPPFKLWNQKHVTREFGNRKRSPLNMLDHKLRFYRDK